LTFAIREHRRVPLPWRNLLQHKLRTALAISGVSFPVLLVFLQLGLYDAALRSASLPFDALEFDAVIVSAEYVSVPKPSGFPRSRLYQALAAPGVVGISTFQLSYGRWKNAETFFPRQIMVLGCDPRQRAFQLPEIAGQVAGLAEPDTVLIDRRTRAEYGPREPGVVTEMEARRVRIIGEYTLGAGFSSGGAVIVGDQTFLRLFPQLPRDEVTFGLVRLDPGSDAGTVVEGLGARLPRDVRVLTRAALEASERAYWSRTASLGIIFGLGVMVGLVVLMVLVYQLLATDITNRLPEYATLKAIGYSDGQLSRVVLQQAALISAPGYALGALVSLGLYSVTAAATHLPVVMTPARLAGVLGLTLALATGSALLALRRLRSADPAALFK
jgi:putative ABC transport system permease protein